MNNPSMAAMSPARLAAFVALAGAVTAATAPVVNYLPAFYSKVLGLSLVDVGLVFFSIRALDFIFDLLAGIVIDRQPFRQAKYRPWLLMSIPVLMLGVWMLFIPPRSLVSLPFVFAGGMLIYLGFSFASIAHQAWYSALARSRGDAAAIFGYREIAVIVGLMGVFIAPAIAEQFYQPDFATKVNIIGYALLASLALTGVIGLWAAWSYDAPRSPAEGSGQRAHLTLKGTLQTLADPCVLKAAVPFMLTFLALTGGGSVTPFLVKDVFGQPDLFARLIGLYFCTATASIFIWLRLAKHFGEWKVLRLSSLSAMVAQASVLVAMQMEGTWALFLHFALVGAHFGAAPFLLRAVIGRVGNRIRAERGADAQGTLYSVGVFAEKVGASLAVLVSFWLIERLCFHADQAATATGNAAVLYAYVGIPVLSYGLIALISMMRAPRVESEPLVQTGTTPRPRVDNLVGTAGIGGRR